MNKTCHQCNNELKLIPAGIAGPKAKNPGKSYKAFWSCPNRCRQEYGPTPSQAQSTPIRQSGANNANDAIMARFDDLEDWLESIDSKLPK